MTRSGNSPNRPPLAGFFMRWSLCSPNFPCSSHVFRRKSLTATFARSLRPVFPDTPRFTGYFAESSGMGLESIPRKSSVYNGLEGKFPKPRNRERKSEDQGICFLEQGTVPEHQANANPSTSAWRSQSSGMSVRSSFSRLRSAGWRPSRMA